MKRKPITQFTLPGEADTFNLCGELLRQDEPPPKPKPDLTLEMFKDELVREMKIESGET
jgi:hypothetical protein